MERIVKRCSPVETSHEEQRVARTHGVSHHGPRNNWLETLGLVRGLPESKLWTQNRMPDHDIPYCRIFFFGKAMGHHNLYRNSLRSYDKTLIRQTMRPVLIIYSWNVRSSWLWHVWWLVVLSRTAPSLQYRKMNTFKLLLLRFQP